MTSAVDGIDAKQMLNSSMNILSFLIIVGFLVSPQREGQIQPFAALGMRTMRGELTV